LLDTIEQELSLSASIGPEGDLLLGLAQADVAVFRAGAGASQPGMSIAWLPLGALAFCLGCGVLAGVAIGVVLFVRKRR
jgi:hypothetical protein